MCPCVIELTCDFHCSFRCLAQAMIHYAARRAYATSLRQGGGGLSRWRAPGRSRSAGTFAVYHADTADPVNTVSA
ncbi:unnamed protein product, partial [Ectocarpus sp. 13 AM-2016]